MLSTKRRTPLGVLVQIENLSNTNTTQKASVLEKQYERIRLSITHRCRRFVIPVDIIIGANPKRKVYASEANKAESDTTCFHSYPPKSCNKRVNSKYLVWCAPWPVGSNSMTMTTREGTHKGDQRGPRCTYLLDDTLSRAIESCSDLLIVNPSDIEDAACSLNSIKYKQAELSQDQYHISRSGGQR